MASATEIYAFDTRSSAGNPRGLEALRTDEGQSLQIRDPEATGNLFESAYRAVGSPSTRPEALQEKACNSCHGTQDIYGDPAQYMSTFAQPYYGYQQYGRGNYMHNPAYRGYAQQVYGDGNSQFAYNQPFYGGFNQPYYGGFNQPYNAGFNQPYYSGFNQPYYGGFNQQYIAGFNQPYYGGFNQPFYGGFNRPYYGGMGGGNLLRYELGSALASLPYMAGGGYGGYGGFGGGNMMRSGLSNLLFSLPYMIGRHGHAHHRSYC